MAEAGEAEEVFDVAALAVADDEETVTLPEMGEAFGDAGVEGTSEAGDDLVIGDGGGFDEAVDLGLREFGEGEADAVVVGLAGDDADVVRGDRPEGDAFVGEDFVPGDGAGVGGVPEGAVEVEDD